jgi:hypothetical protein
MRLVAGYPPRRPGFDSRSSHVRFVVDKMALGQVSSEYFGFPCQFSFHQMLHSYLSSGAGTIGKLVADVPSGLSLTPPHETKKKKRKNLHSVGGILRINVILPASSMTLNSAYCTSPLCIYHQTGTYIPMRVSYIKLPDCRKLHKVI